MTLGTRPSPTEGAGNLERWAVAATLGLFASQCATGLAIAFYYAPTASGALASLEFFRANAPLGPVVHAMHAWGASALLVSIAVGLGAALHARAWPRWWLGLVVLVFTLAAAGTGNLLPWDMHAWAAGSVQLAWTAKVPLVGALKRLAVQGGPTLGNLTLARFYALHLTVLTAAAVAAAVAWRRHAAPEASWWEEAASAGAATLVLALAALAIPRELEEAASPALLYDPRPEWYFRPLYELLRWEGSASAVVAWPALLAGALAAVPWTDERWRPFRAGAALAAGFVLALGGLTWAGYARDRRDRPETARRLFASQCASCHGLDGRGKLEDVELPDLSDPAWQKKKADADILKVIRDGKKGEEAEMPAFGDRLSRQQMTLALEHIRALGAP